MKYAFLFTSAALVSFFCVSAFGEEGLHGRTTALEKRVVAAIAADGVQRVEITGGEYFFDPNTIVVKVNVPVELEVKKTPGFAPHNITVKAPEAGIDFTVDLAKEPKPVKFTPTKTGAYPLYCDKRFLWFKTHRERGMEGMIEVVQ